MPEILINDNGKICAPEEAKVSALDRGFLYGDSLYEVFRAEPDFITRMPEHLNRLFVSAKLCRMTLSQSTEEFETQLQNTLRQFHETYPHIPHVYLRLIVSRGKSKIGFGKNMVESITQYWIIAKELPLPNNDAVNKGARLQISSRVRNHPKALDPAMKSGNYLNNLLAYLEAEEMGFDDALLCNQEGHITEGTTFNIFYLRRGILATPPLDIGILDGITRKDVIKTARSLGYEVREIRFSTDHLKSADEIFITSTIKEVFPVVQIDEKIISDGKPGKETLRLRKEYIKWMNSLRI